MRLYVTQVDKSRAELSWNERWEGADGGLISAWERGREKATEDRELAQAARQGELVILPWKGGVERATKQAKKFGSFLYLAMWQGLRGEPLDIELSEEVSITCTRTGMTITYTPDSSKYFLQE